MDEVLYDRTDYYGENQKSTKSWFVNEKNHGGLWHKTGSNKNVPFS